MLHMLPTSYARHLILQPKNGLVHQVLFVIAFCLVLQVLDLMPQADSITKLASRCSYCEAAGHQRAALFSLRCRSASSKTTLLFCDDVHV